MILIVGRVEALASASILGCIALEYVAGFCGFCQVRKFLLNMIRMMYDLEVRNMDRHYLAVAVQNLPKGLLTRQLMAAVFELSHSGRRRGQAVGPNGVQ